MVNIKHYPLGALKQNAFIIGPGRRQKAPALPGKSQKLVTHCQKISIDGLGICRWLTGSGQPNIMMRHQCIKLVSKCRFRCQIAQSDRPARHFIFIGRANTATSRAYFLRTAQRFTRGVDSLVNRQDQRGRFRHQQCLRRNFCALRSQ